VDDGDIYMRMFSKLWQISCQGKSAARTLFGEAAASISPMHGMDQLIDATSGVER
jgi:hypothetical protein